HGTARAGGRARASHLFCNGCAVRRHVERWRANAGDYVGRMMSVTMHDVDLDDLEDTVGPLFYARGVQHVRRNAVVQMRWDPSTGTLYGTVRGMAGAFYTTMAVFETGDEFTSMLGHGLCSCPEGYNCEHVAALVLAARAEHSGPTAGRNPRPAGWEQSLGSL